MAVYLWRTDKESQSGPEIEVTVDRVAQSLWLTSAASYPPRHHVSCVCLSHTT